MQLGQPSDLKLAESGTVSRGVAIGDGEDSNEADQGRGANRKKGEDACTSPDASMQHQQQKQEVHEHQQLERQLQQQHQNATKEEQESQPQQGKHHQQEKEKNWQQQQKQEEDEEQQQQQKQPSTKRLRQRGRLTLGAKPLLEDPLTSAVEDDESLDLLRSECLSLVQGVELPPPVGQTPNRRLMMRLS